ncbi:MAG: hypothetical protein RLZZ536_2521 [Planctomycetota bacterium]
MEDAQTTPQSPQHRSHRRGRNTPKRTGLRRPTVSAVIGERAALGLIRIVHAGGLNQGISEYEIRALVDR